MHAFYAIFFAELALWHTLDDWVLPQEKTTLVMSGVLSSDGCGMHSTSFYIVRA